MILWSEVLNDWEKGIPFSYPKKIKTSFQWNTSVLKKNSIYIDSFAIDKFLPIKQDTTIYKEYFDKSNNKYVVSFLNLDKTIMLITPMPRKNKNFATLKNFIDNACKKQQVEFWKKVAEEAKKMMLKKGKVWISVHGHGVAYTHVRISPTPKYYFDSMLKNLS